MKLSARLSSNYEFNSIYIQASIHFHKRNHLIKERRRKKRKPICATAISFGDINFTFVESNTCTDFNQHVCTYTQNTNIMTYFMSKNSFSFEFLSNVFSEDRYRSTPIFSMKFHFVIRIFICIKIYPLVIDQSPRFI